MCVTVQLSLDQVHPGADLVVKRFDVLQQVQLTVGHRRREVAVFLFYVEVVVRHDVCIRGGVGRLLVDIFRFYLLQKQTDAIRLFTAIRDINPSR